MPLGVLTIDQTELELKRFGIAVEAESNIVNFNEMKRGRGNKEEIPVSVRSFVASEALSGADVNQLSKDYNVSKSSISAYKNGATSTSSYNEPDPVLTSLNDNVRARIIGPAQARILKAINSITDDKLNESKARDAASIAASLSSVIKNISPDENSGNKTQVNVFVPRKNEEDDYEVIRVD